jgi:arylsulfate sulfotransferase
LQYLLSHFDHDGIRTLPNGYIALMADTEKIFPAGTQGDTSGLPVDIVGAMIVVLNQNWQVVWYWDAFEHDSGAPQLDINRPALLGETCAGGQQGCSPIFLTGQGIAPSAKDWLHTNSLYYWPNDGSIIMSVRHQDWVVKIDYGNGSGTGNILWRMGPNGDFTFNNINNDPWPWFSHQHEVGIENNGAGPMTIFDNGNTRVSPPPLGMGSGDSRGMALTVDEANMQVTPVLSVDLGNYSTADGSAQLLSNGDYYFLVGIVVAGLNNDVSYSVQVCPTAGSTDGTVCYRLEGADGYRGWQIPSLYSPPTT